VRVTEWEEEVVCVTGIGSKESEGAVLCVRVTEWGKSKECGSVIG